MVTYVGSLIICSLSSRKGAKNAKAPRGMQVFAAWREKISSREEGLSQRRRERKGRYDPCTDRYVIITSCMIIRAALGTLLAKASQEL